MASHRDAIRYLKLGKKMKKKIYIFMGHYDPSKQEKNKKKKKIGCHGPS